MHQQFRSRARTIFITSSQLPLRVKPRGQQPRHAGTAPPPQLSPPRPFRAAPSARKRRRRRSLCFAPAHSSTIIKGTPCAFFRAEAEKQRQAERLGAVSTSSGTHGRKRRKHPVRCRVQRAPPSSAPRTPRSPAPARTSATYCARVTGASGSRRTTSPCRHSSAPLPAACPSARWYIG